MEILWCQLTVLFLTRHLFIFFLEISPTAKRMRLYDIQLLSGTSWRWELRYFLIPPPGSIHEDRRARRHIERFYQRYVAWGNPNGYVEPIVEGYDIAAVMQELNTLLGRFQQRRLPTWTEDQYCTHLLSVYWRLVRFMRYPGLDLDSWIIMIEGAQELVERWIATHNPFGVHNFMRKPEKYWLSRDHVWHDIVRRADLQRQERDRLYRLERQVLLWVPPAVDMTREIGVEKENMASADAVNIALGEREELPEGSRLASGFRPVEEADDMAECPNADVAMLHSGGNGSDDPTGEHLPSRMVGISCELEEDVLLLSSASSTSSATAARREIFVYLSSELDTSSNSAAASMFLGFALEKLADSCLGSAECECRGCWLKRQQQEMDGAVIEEEEQSSESRSSAGCCFAEWPLEVPPIGFIDVGTELDVGSAVWGRTLNWISTLPTAMSDSGIDTADSPSEMDCNTASQWQLVPFVPRTKETWWQTQSAEINRNEGEQRNVVPTGDGPLPMAFHARCPTRGPAPGSRVATMVPRTDSISLRGRLRGRRPIPDIVAIRPPRTP
jgi:hypothetical protein